MIYFRIIELTIEFAQMFAQIGNCMRVHEIIITRFDSLFKKQR